MKKLLFESLNDYITNDKRILESFSSNNLIQFDKWVKANSRHAYEREKYLKGGLFYNQREALKPSMLTNKNSGFFDDVYQAFDFVSNLVKTNKNVGVLVGQVGYGVMPMLAKDFLKHYARFEEAGNVFLVFFKDENVDNVPEHKPKPRNRYKWGGEEISYLGNTRENDFKARQANLKKR